MSHVMPQNYYRPERCFALPSIVFDTLYAALKPEERFVDERLHNNGVLNVLLITKYGRQACFYVNPQNFSDTTGRYPDGSYRPCFGDKDTGV